MIKRVFCITFCFILIFVFFVVPCSAISFSSTYSDLSYSSSTVNNLITYAMNYDSFLNREFVVFRPSQYDYYIVWGHLRLSGSSVTSTGQVEYIRYYRDTYGDYHYQYSTDTDFLLNSDNVNISNIDGYGFKSPTFSTFKFESDVLSISIFSLGFIFLIALCRLRRSN